MDIHGHLHCHRLTLRPALLMDAVIEINEYDMNGKDNQFLQKRVCVKLCLALILWHSITRYTYYLKKYPNVRYGIFSTNIVKSNMCNCKRQCKCLLREVVILQHNFTSGLMTQ